MAKHLKKKNKKFMFLSLLRIIFFIALVISTINIIKWYNDSRQNKLIEEKILDVIISDDNEQDAYKIDFEKLKTINNQTIGWLKVNGTNIEYPVVQANDNSYYLRQNFNKEYNIGGWIFTDYKNKLDGTDKNIVIYGHSMKDNSMFGNLKNILSEEWYNNEQNCIIDFITEKEESKYKVFSVYQIKSEEYYIDTEFENNEFEEFVKTLKNRSIKDFNVDISSEDNILTLSTCGNTNKYRVVLHAKKIID